MIRKLMFRLLPVQVILAAVGTVNMIVSSYFASNYVGTEAMSAVGLYGPLNMFFGATATMLVGGSSILCGEYLGQNRQDKLQEVLLSRPFVIRTGRASFYRHNHIPGGF